MVRTLFALVLAPALFAGAAAQPPAPGTDLSGYREHHLEAAPAPKNGAVTVTFLGTTTLLFDDGETQLLTDGFLTRPPITKLLNRIETDPKTVDAALKKAGADRVKALFVAHAHYDHAMDCAYVAQKTGAKLHGSASVLNIGRGGGLKDEQMALFEPGKELKVGKFTVTVLKGKHSPPLKGLNDDLGQEIAKPLKQPAGFRDYKEGGSFDFLIKHGDRTALVNCAANFVEGARDGVRADVLFLSVGALGGQPKEFQTAFYDQTVPKVKPKLVIPIHYDDFTQPLSDSLRGLGDTPAAFDFVIARLKADKIRFGLLQGYARAQVFPPTK
jgi:L-ascorbate metabolism protein UlaG (beta-lactamase superfamily)